MKTLIKSGKNVYVVMRQSDLKNEFYNLPMTITTTDTGWEKLRISKDKIKLLLKDYGLTIKGAKALLEKQKTNLDVDTIIDVDKSVLKSNFKKRILNLKKLLFDLRNIENGKKKLN